MPAGDAIAVKKVPRLQETWMSSHFSWNPGNQIITATSAPNKKAAVKGRKLVPAFLHKNLFGRRKTVKANIVVEKVGNAYEIVEIFEN